ncbi:lysozyme inhibitor LprI family protein [Vibrio maritimus]|uniref:lysozyme inhibitor LprI family protein n=1 Tax=Vibrio maritimus TaxID=990268 RepID=UPI0040691F41
MLYKIMTTLLCSVLSFSVKAYINIEFSDDLDIKIEQRKLDYKNGDVLLNKQYMKILEYLKKYDMDTEFKEAQRSWLKYKIESCSGKEFFENTDVSSDIMTQYLIADCMSWVTYARLLEFNYIESRKIELAYILRPNKVNSELEYYTDSWKDYVSKSCRINSKLHNEKIEQCLERLNYYYREVDL